MNRKRAEDYYNPIILCPLCEHIEGLGDTNVVDEARARMIEHLVEKHSDEEAIELFGWIGLYPEE